MTTLTQSVSRETPVSARRVLLVSPPGAVGGWRDKALDLYDRAVDENRRSKQGQDLFGGGSRCSINTWVEACHLADKVAERTIAESDVVEWLTAQVTSEGQRWSLRDKLEPFHGQKAYDEASAVFPPLVWSDRHEVRQRRLAIAAAIGPPSIGLDGAIEHFRFRGGGPVPGQLYVLHPIESDLYLAAAAAVVDVERERFAAFCSILGAVGAKTVTVLSCSAQSMKASAAATAKGWAASVGLHVDVDSNGQVVRQVVREYGPPGQRRLVLPGDLVPWLAEQPELASSVRGRLEHNLLKDRVVFGSSSSVSASVSAAAEYSKMGFSLGGHVEGHAAMTWLFEVEYWPLQ